MKKLIQSLTVLSLAMSFVFIQGCRKPKPKEDPCKNPVQVTALDLSQYSFGHFNNQGMYLYAVNFSNYANQVVPGNEYQISYVEVQCNDAANRCGNGIAAGGCFPQKHCIRITCLKPIAMNCLGSVLNPANFSELHSSMIDVYGINGRSLKARAGFSGCSETNYSNLRLHLQLVPTTGPTSSHVWNAKIAYANAGDFMCQAYFEKDMCFDLSAINNYYMLLNMTPPKEVAIRFVKDEENFDFPYAL